MTTNTNDILGTDELSRPITRAQMLGTDGAVPRLRLLSEIVGPLQPFLQDILRLTEIQQKNVEYYQNQNQNLRKALVDLLKADIEAKIESEFDRRSDSWIHSDNIGDSILDEIMSNRRIRAEISEIAANCIDTGDIKSDIQSDIKRDLEYKISDGIADYDFGDMLDDHTRDIDEKIVKRLVDEISDDSSHPLVNAIAEALALRLRTASK